MLAIYNIINKEIIKKKKISAIQKDTNAQKLVYLK
jgi:hypothetical protein